MYRISAIVTKFGTLEYNKDTIAIVPQANDKQPPHAPARGPSLLPWEPVQYPEGDIARVLLSKSNHAVNHV